MAGTYLIDLNTGGASNYGVNYTVCEVGSFNSNGFLNSMAVRFNAAGNFLGKIVVYSNAGTLVASSATQSLSVANNSTYYDIALTTPYAITSGTTYKIGIYTPSTGVYPMVNTNASSSAVASSPAGISWTPSSLNHQYITGDANPTTNNNYRLQVKMYLDTDVNPPNAPTSVSVTNSPVPLGSMATATWTHSDAESSTQQKFQIRWRKV